MSRRAPRPQPLPASRRGRYIESSRRPLETLVFLLPLILFYEWGLMAWLRSGEGTHTNKAHGGIVDFFRLFGVRAEHLGLPWLALPAVGLVLTLLAWQVIGGFPWRMRAATIGWMLVESFGFAAPLLPVGMLMSRMETTMLAVPPQEAMRQMGVMERAAMAAGAGVYEELAFRMVVMGGLHMLLSDVGGWRRPGAWVAAMIASALLFAVYHPLRAPDGAFEWWRFAFLLVGGAWFGTLYHWRGFGIAAGTHAAYDFTALLLWRA